LISYDSLRCLLINMTLFYSTDGYKMNCTHCGCASQIIAVRLEMMSRSRCQKESRELARRLERYTVLLSAACQSAHITISTCSNVYCLLSLLLACTKTHTHKGWLQIAPMGFFPLSWKPSSFVWESQLGVSWLQTVPVYCKWTFRVFVLHCLPLLFGVR
jgi:hypothetical protein